MGRKYVFVPVGRRSGPDLREETARVLEIPHHLPCVSCLACCFHRRIRCKILHQHRVPDTGCKTHYYGPRLQRHLRRLPQGCPLGTGRCVSAAQLPCLCHSQVILAGDGVFAVRVGSSISLVDLKTNTTQDLVSYTDIVDVSVCMCFRRHLRHIHTSPRARGFKFTHLPLYVLHTVTDSS